MVFNQFNKIDQWLQKDRSRNVKAFRMLLYSWVILNTLTYLPNHAFFWGANSWIQNVPLENQSIFFKSLHILSFPQISQYYFFVIVLQILSCIFAMTGVYPRLASFFSWYFTVILYNKVYLTLDGGNNVISLMLFFAIFMNTNSVQRGTCLKIIDSYVTNWAFLLGRIQLCIVYFVAGHLKMTGTHWTNGTAFYYTFNVDEFSTPLLKFLFTQFSPLSVVFSYSTVLFQICFPLLIWFKETRPALFFIGGLMHLGIAFGMGLMSFGFAMTICYSLFFTDHELDRLIEIKNRIQHLLIRFLTLKNNNFVFPKRKKSFHEKSA